MLKCAGGSVGDVDESSFYFKKFVAQYELLVNYGEGSINKESSLHEKPPSVQPARSRVCSHRLFCIGIRLSSCDTYSEAKPHSIANACSDAITPSLGQSYSNSSHSYDSVQRVEFF